MLQKRMRAKNIKLLSKGIVTPKIPRAFIKNISISRVLHLAINEFNFEEQSAIVLYFFAELPVSEIATLTKLSAFHVISTLVLYTERLAFKVNVFKKAVPYDATDLASVREVLELGVESGVPQSG